MPRLIPQTECPQNESSQVYIWQKIFMDSSCHNPGEVLHVKEFGRVYHSSSSFRHCSHDQAEPTLSYTLQMWLKLFSVNHWPSSFVANTNHEEWMLVLSFCCLPCRPYCFKPSIMDFSIFFIFENVPKKLKKLYFSFVMQFLLSDKLLGVHEQMLCKLRCREERHSQTAFCGNEGKATELTSSTRN